MPHKCMSQLLWFTLYGHDETGRWANAQASCKPCKRSNQQTLVPLLFCDATIEHKFKSSSNARRRRPNTTHPQRFTCSAQLLPLMSMRQGWAFFSWIFNVQMFNARLAAWRTTGSKSKCASSVRISLNRTLSSRPKVATAAMRVLGNLLRKHAKRTIMLLSW